MRKNLLSFLVLIITFTAGYGQGEFKTLWDSPTTIDINVFGGGVINYTWSTVGGGATVTGSGSVTPTSSSVATQLVISTLPSNRMIELELSPLNLKGIVLGTNTPYAANKLIDVVQWGTANWTKLEVAFSGCHNLINISAADNPNLSQVSSLYGTFANTYFGGDLSSWDVSNVTNMSYMFYEAFDLNTDLSGWDVSKVTNMEYMFFNAADFNGNISTWDVSSVTDMQFMFAGASSFNSDLSQWDVSNVVNMEGMFASSLSFNSDMPNWDVSNVINFKNLFNGSNFNGDISGWDVSGVSDMQYMFSGSNFNGDLSAWDVSNVANMNFMFSSSAFNGDVSTWDVSGVVNMANMFRNASNFNGDISSWDVSNVIYSGSLFYNATSFNSDISQWDVTTMLGLSRMFYGASSFDQDLSQWDMTNMTGQFNCYQFLRFSGLSCENYSKFLVGQANNPNLPDGLTISETTLLYGNDAIAARNTLVNTKGWTITGDSPSGFNCLSVPLPVELLNFSVQSSPQGHQATWSTASELNNSNFILEHSLGDDSFEELGLIEGKGTTSKANNYEYIHATAEPGVHYYRLRQVDFDGASTYSDVVSVKRVGASALAVYPNPADQTLTLQGVAEGDQFVLSDALGRVVLAGKYNGNELAVDQLPAGTYVVQVGDAGVAKRFVKL